MPCFCIKKCFPVIVALLICGCQVSWAQQNNSSATVNVSGKVLDDFGHPLAGVRVNVKGSTSSTITNPSGLFRLDVPAGAGLVLSHPLFNVTEVTAGANKDVTIKLTERY